MCGDKQPNIASIFDDNDQSRRSLACGSTGDNTLILQRKKKQVERKKENKKTMAVLPPDPVFNLRQNDIGSINAICMHQDQRLISGSAKGVIHLWDLQVI